MIFGRNIHKILKIEFACFSFYVGLLVISHAIVSQTAYRKITRALLLALVSCWARLFLQYLNRRTLWIICDRRIDRRIPRLTWNYSDCFGGSEVCLPDSAPATQLSRCFHQYPHCVVCRCPDVCRLLRTSSTSPVACGYCSSSNFYPVTLL